MANGALGAKLSNVITLASMCVQLFVCIARHLAHASTNLLNKGKGCQALISDEVIALALTYLLVELLVIWAYFRAVCLDTAACFIGPSFVVGVTALWNALALAQVKVEELSL